ncbi:MAG: Mth938-like domain-containing protein [Gammaproteobacteria bacterium]
MKLEIEQPGKDLYRIDSYNTGVICINGEHLTASLIITPRLLIHDWPPQSFADIASQHIEQIIQLRPEIIILGTGRQLLFLAPPLTVLIHQYGIGFETMDTGAACRSYNLLMSEGRNVAAGLLIPAP